MVHLGFSHILVILVGYPNKLLVRFSKLVILFCALTWGVVFHASAQLCQGSLGDPIVNITFGAGANPGAPLKAATTTYQYQSTDCPNDGFYTVRNNTTDCFGSTWHSLSRDHTGDANGYFMLVNASVTPSAFYLDTVRGLCGGTTYEFAAWIMNVLKPTACSPNPTQPNLTFTIENTDGTVLQTYNTNTINSTASPQWRQFGFYFTTPMGVSDIVLRIFNNAPGGCGNDLALDDITFRPCGPLIESMFADTPDKEVTICEGEARTFTLNGSLSQGFTDPAMNWQQSTDGINWTDIPGATSFALMRDFDASTAPGRYFFRLSAAEAGNMGSPNCRIASDALLVEVSANPVSQITTNSPVCEKGTITLLATGGETYHWTGPAGFTSTAAITSVPNAQFVNAGKYFLSLYNEHGCESKDSVIVDINPSPVATVQFTEATICLGESIQLSSGGGLSYQWIPAEELSSADIADPVATPSVNREYAVVVYNEHACSDTANVSIKVLELPTADAGPDRWVIEGTTITLNGMAGGQDITYSWSPGIYLDNPNLLQPLMTPLRDTSYVLTVVSNAGCGVATDTMQVFVYKDVFIPNAFSPNNDGLNDVWQIPVLIAYPGFELTIFNRYGQIIFRTKDAGRGWDGTYKGEPQPVGAYVYMLDLNDGSPVRKGTLTLIR